MFIETVGVGQDEVDIVRTADVSIVTLVPGTGDDVQALKAGIMEIADIFVVNKADREGADRTVASIEAMLSLQTFGRTNGGRRCCAPRRRRAGVAELLEAIERFRAHGGEELGERRKTRAACRLRELLGDASCGTSRAHEGCSSRASSTRSSSASRTASLTPTRRAMRS